MTALSFDDAIALCHTENERFAAALRNVRDDQWANATDCDLWTVRDLVGHVLGSLDVNASVVRSGLAFAKATLRARRNGTQPLDEGTKAEVEAYARVPTHELVATFERLAPGNIAGRRRMPRLLRPVAIPFEGGKLRLGEVAGVVLTRDIWMHRVDLTRATDQVMELAPEHDGRIVADVVASWAAAHGRAYTLRLTGPAGGVWSRDDGPLLELDAVEFCRILAGRVPSDDALMSARVVF